MQKRSRSLTRLAVMVFADTVAVTAIAILSLLLRFDFRFAAVPDGLFTVLKFLILFIVIIKLSLFIVCKLYSTMWQFASVSEVFNIILAAFLSEACICILSVVTDSMLPLSFYIVDLVLTIAAVSCLRLMYKLRSRFSLGMLRGASKQERVMLIGAGKMGLLMIEELTNEKYQHGKAVVIVDDDPGKIGKRLRGIKIAGSCKAIPGLAVKYRVDKIIFCIPSASLEDKRRILDIALSTRCRVKVAQSIHKALVNDSQVNQLRDVDVADLLARPVVNLATVDCSYLTDQVILVTGGGGSIGSELCRQVARFYPKQIVIVDIYENNAYELQNELKDAYGDKIDIQIRIGSVRDIRRLEQIFREFRPSVVFHAAAHKHVPLLQDSPGEAVKNNIIGTLNAAKVARTFGVSRFVLLSTDKAVNPTSVMGATKRITEMIVQALNWYNSTIYAAVRFGNVLGSNGSVIPLFKKQIEKGGPVTITHPDITRYFMTIPEAAQLVIQACGLAKGGEVFVLDMGEPVKIIDLAHNLIKLSGLVPEVDIKIDYVGLRPGEKLYEELSYKEEEGMKTTVNSKIFVTPPLIFDTSLFRKQLDYLEKIAVEGNEAELNRVIDDTINMCFQNPGAENKQLA